MKTRVKKSPNLRYLPLTLIVLALIAVSLFFSAFDPEEYVRWIGVENAYLLLFILAFFSGILTFSVIPYHLLLITFALGGLSPWLLGLSAASGVMLGDCTSYLIGYYGRTVIPERAQPMVRRLSSFLERYPRLLPLFFFAYGCVAPFSNDLVGITMGVARYPMARVMIPLGLGNLVFNTALALVAVHVRGSL